MGCGWVALASLVVAGSEDQDGNKENCGDYASELASMLFLPSYAGR